MNSLDSLCVDFYTGVHDIWGYLGISWHHILQAFVTGLIIKAGYWCMHQIMPKKPRKANSMATMSAIGSVIDESH